VDRRATPGRPYGLLAGFERRLKWGARRTCPYDENLPRGVPQFPLSSPYPPLIRSSQKSPRVHPVPPRPRAPCPEPLGVNPRASFFWASQGLPNCDSTGPASDNLSPLGPAHVVWSRRLQARGRRTRRDRQGPSHRPHVENVWYQVSRKAPKSCMLMEPAGGATQGPVAASVRTIEQSGPAPAVRGHRLVHDHWMRPHVQLPPDRRLRAGLPLLRKLRRNRNGSSSRMAAGSRCGTCQPTLRHNGNTASFTQQRPN
jgi:hypothetical protein